MTSKNSAWHEQRKTKIGDYGERLIREHLEKLGCICYKSVTDGPHPCDFFMFNRDKHVIAVEVKTKPARKKYPDTGFDLRHYNGYKKFTEEHSMYMFIFFVDEERGEIYGNYLHKLDETRISNGMSYPTEERTKYGQIIRYYPLSAMIPIRKLSREEICELKRLRSDKS